jgi:hypothetical protein
VLLKYQSGEEIRKSDRARFLGEPGQIEFVAVDKNDPELDWYVQKFGRGVMVLDEIAGRTFIPVDQIDEGSRAAKRQLSVGARWKLTCAQVFLKK